MTRVPDLPLFRKAELDVLQERRDALLKRLQGMRPHSHCRVALQDRLQAVTAEMLKLETQSRRGLGR